MQVWSQATFYAMLTLQNARGPLYVAYENLYRFDQLWNSQ